MGDGYGDRQREQGEPGRMDAARKTADRQFLRKTR
jgi:hypothetical protein